MRRLIGLSLSALLAVTVLVAPATAAPAQAASDTVTLAAAADEPVGPEPQDREAEDNRARELVPQYEDPETPFTWGAAWLLTFAGMVGLVLLGGLYYLLVHRPSQEDTGRR